VLVERITRDNDHYILNDHISLRGIGSKSCFFLGSCRRRCSR